MATAETGVEGRDRVTEIRLAAKQVFSSRGYNGTSMRDIASAVGLNTATLYHYHRDKQALFFDVVMNDMETLCSGIRVAASTETDASERLRRVIRWIVEYNAAATRMTLTSELRFMDADLRERVVRVRDEMQHTVEQVIRDGIEEGTFAAGDVKLGAYLVFSIGYSVSSWYRPGGRLGVDGIAKRFTEIVLKGLAAPS